MKLFLFAFSAAALAGCSVPPTRPANVARDDLVSTQAYVTRLVQHEMALNKVPGLSLALVDDQRIVWAQGFGFADVERGIPASAETLYRVGSISKLFTATGAMQLAEPKTGIQQPIRSKSAWADTPLSEDVRNAYAGDYTTMVGPVHINADGNGLHVNALGHDFKLRPRKDGLLGLDYKLLGIVSVQMGTLSDIGFSLRTVDGRKLLVAQAGKQAMLVGQRIEAPVSLGAWQQRLGDYEISNLVGTLVIDPQQQSVSLGDRVLAVTPREFSILCELARQAGRVVRREQLLQRVWSGDELPSAGALEFQIHALRRKLGVETIRTAVARFSALNLSTEHAGAVARVVQQLDKDNATLPTKDTDFAWQTRAFYSQLDVLVLRQMVTTPLVYMTVLVIALWLATWRGLKPLQQLGQRIAMRDAGSREPLTDVVHDPLELQPLTTALDAYAVREAELRANEKRFFADAAHELRTPLAVIGAQAHVLLQEPDSARQPDMLHSLQRGVQRAGDVLSKVLTLSRLDASPVGDAMDTATTVDLGEMLRERIAEHTQRAIEREIDLGLLESASVLVSGNVSLISVAMDNLIDNALLYCPQGSHIDVSFGKKGGYAWWAVEDDGPGIDPEQQALVFD
eukprot:gene6261-6121_t